MGEYDFSEERLQDTDGINPPTWPSKQAPISGAAELPKVLQEWKVVKNPVRDLVPLLEFNQGAPSTPERPEMLRAWAKPLGPLAKAIFHPLSSVLESFARIMQFR